ncbi:hypothetical protein QBC41DRAFT_362701 [Cercophora samala]|uniref:Uncharacterized protein n=1 Tax=Cercophora samala TaxID=330535 RepID=A0AA40DD36_9PEZI|nr:hypothetical protein QBC41DRAFT_362701 [Cercophora samala]
MEHRSRHQPCLEDQEPGEKSRLSRYLTQTGLASQTPDIQTAIAQGAHDVRAIMTNPLSSTEIFEFARKLRHSPESVRQVSSIMWYLTSLSVERDQAFVTGAYLVRDPEGRLSAYFRGVCTPRISSHLKGHSAPGCTNGIDLRAAVGGSGTAASLPPLPHGHCHVLSISITNDKRRGNCLFLKPERYGVHGIRNLTHHAVMYAKSLKRQHTFGANEVVGMRKERIPDHLVASFGEAVDTLADGPQAIAEVGRRGKGEGIAAMHEFLTNKLGCSGVVLPEHTRERMGALLTQLESQYDFVGLRFGNEVVVDLPAELANPLPRAPGVCGPSPPLSQLSSDPSEWKDLVDET